MEKTCNICGKTKPLSEFYKRAQCNDGHDYKCILCGRAYAKERYAANQKRIREQSMTRYYKNHDRVKELMRKRAARARKNDSGRYNQYMKEWRETHPEQYALIHAKQILKQNGTANAPQKLIELKAAQLLVARQLKESHRV